MNIIVSNRLKTQLKYLASVLFKITNFIFYIKVLNEATVFYLLFLPVSA